MPRRQRILIADDAPGVCWALSRILRSRGFDCVAAQDGSTALSLLAERPCELVLADIYMPGNERLELVKELSRVAPRTPVILMTGHPSLDSTLDAIDLSVRGYLVKPFEKSALLDRVARALGSADVAARAEETEGTASAAVPEPRPTDRRARESDGEAEGASGGCGTRGSRMGPWVAAFLEHSLRRASKDTVTAYGTALTQLLRYVADGCETPEDEVRLDQVTEDILIGFLGHLRDTRGCGPATCNARLSACRSFFRWVAATAPGVAPSIRVDPSGPRLSPRPRSAEPPSAEDVEAIIEAPGLETALGRRDRALLLLFAQTRLTVSTLMGLDVGDVLVESGATVLAVARRGKPIGVRLPARAGEAVQALCLDRAHDPGDNEALFVSARGRRLTKNAIHAILRRATVAASADRPALQAWRASIPSFRRAAAKISA